MLSCLIWTFSCYLGPPTVIAATVPPNFRIVKGDAHPARGCDRCYSSSVAVERAGRKGSRADGVSASIREDILAGRFEPGQRLTFPDLCAAYSVSVGVLREALVRLVDRGIVQAESNLGFRVMSLSEKDFQELTAVRAMVEPSFVRQAIKVGSPRWEADLVAAHHFMDRQPLTADGRLSDGLVRAHAEFHLVLVSGTGNRRMMEIVSRLRDEADLYQRWYLDVDQVEQRSDRIHREDRELLAAVLDRDLARAEQLLRFHIGHSTETWVSEPEVASTTTASVARSS